MLWSKSLSAGSDKSITFRTCRMGPGAHLVQAGDVFRARADILTLLALPRAEVHADVRQGERLPRAGLSSQHRRDWLSDLLWTKRLFHQPKVLKEVGGYRADGAERVEVSVMIVVINVENDVRSDLRP